MYNKPAMLLRNFVVLLALPVAAQYRAGVSRIDITPKPGHAMGGYSARSGNATGTHDPLQATVLVLESNGERFAWITADLRSFLSTRVGQEVKRRFGIGHTVISVSHTHSGPLTWEARESPWYAIAEDKMIAAVEQASLNLRPATLATGHANVYIGFNRRKISEDGTATMQWRNETKRPSHPVDSEVTVLVVQSEGKPKAVLVNYACHPSILGPDNLAFSADYPGAMRQALEQALPGALALFVQGGAGDINPYRDKEPVPAGFDAARNTGAELAKAAATAVQRAKPIAGPLKITSEITEVANRWKPTGTISIGITTAMIGDGAFCLLALPGEPFVEHQLTFREKSECGTSMLAGYSYSVGGTWAGYIPTIKAAVEGGYGANYNTTVAVGTGEMLIDHGVIRLLQMRGLLKELPDAQ